MNVHGSVSETTFTVKYTASQKHVRHLRQMLTVFQNSFTVALRNKFAARFLLYLPSHRKHVVTLPCETQLLKFHRAQ